MLSWILAYRSLISNCLCNDELILIDLIYEVLYKFAMKTQSHLLKYKYISMPLWNIRTFPYPHKMRTFWMIDLTNHSKELFSVTKISKFIVKKKKGVISSIVPDRW